MSSLIILLILFIVLQTFGYELKTLVVNKSTKLYYLINTLPNKGHLKLSQHAQGYRTVLGLVLAYIFMNRGPVERSKYLI